MSLRTEQRRLSLEELQQRKVLLDNTWILVIVLGAMLAVVSWYLGVVQLDMAPVVWSLGSVALIQYVLNARAQRYRSVEELRTAALTSQAIGMIGVGFAWHLFGGVHQPMFPSFLLLPLLASALVLNFWQQQTALAALFLLLLSGVVLSPDTNSFIQARYGLGFLATDALPAWLPRSRVAFADVSTSPSYDLMTMATIAVVAVAVDATARAIVTWFDRALSKVHELELELGRTQALATQMVTHATDAELIVGSGGRIQQASARFIREFHVPEPCAGRFLLDVVSFAYPSVIKRLIASGGAEVQAATVLGREVALRIRADVIELDGVQVSRVRLESCEELCWRGALDALEEPVFAIDSRGDLVFLNRTATNVFGTDLLGGPAAPLFDAKANLARWWDIAPLASARRILDRDGRQYLACIRLERVAESIGELAFVHLQEREHALAAAVA